MRELEIVVGIDEAETPELVRARAADALGRRAGDLGGALVVRRSLDARKGRAPVYRLRLRVFDVGEVGASATTHVEGPANPATGVRRGVVVVVGAGPAGSFAARTLVRAGVGRVLVCELGKPVQARRHDIAALVRRGVLAPDSNYCFGEGGAGTFSDGKLYTRSKDRERVAAVLAALVGYGADPEIEIDSRPHVGSNHLPKILLGLRADLEARGVEYRWQAPLVDLVVGDGGRVRAVRLGGAAPEELACDAVVLATGHSARPVYELLARLGVALAPKAFAVGARVEHPQPLIDELQYGRTWARHPRLPAAFYQLTTQAESRGVYSFCMCPGGWVVDSSTEPGMLATNGMSLKRRDSPYANAALVVTVEPADVAPWGAHPGDPLAGLAFQRALERAAFTAGGGGFVAPAQRLTDFVAGRASGALLRSSYRPRVVAGDLGAVLPAPIAKALRAGVAGFERTMRGFLTAEAQLVGVETRTSSPVRVVRDDETLASPSHAGLYPCAEGAGYAGGIVSAAVDGMRVGEAVLGALARGASGG